MAGKDLLAIEWNDWVRWINKGLLFWNLKKNDVLDTNSIRKSFKCLQLGLGIALFIEGLIFLLFNPKLELGKMLTVPIYVVIHIPAILSFLLLLYATLSIFKAKPLFRSVTSITFYTFSDAMPVSMGCLGVFLNKAVSLYVSHSGTPGLNYLGAAVTQLLTGEAMPSFAIVLWTLFSLAVLTFIVFSLNMIRILRQSTSVSHHTIKVIASFILTLGLHRFVLYPYLMRFYWAMVGILLSK